MDAIFNRRSIRKYEDKAVNDDMIEKVISAGKSGNERWWRYEYYRTTILKSR